MDRTNICACCGKIVYCENPARLHKKKRIQKKYIKKYGMVWGYRDANGMFHRLYIRGTSSDHYCLKNYRLSLKLN